MSDPLDAYLAELRRALSWQGARRARILEEVREHLLEAVEAGEREGLSSDAAARVAIDQLGAAPAIAEEFMPEGTRRMQKVLLAAALALGIMIAYGDSRPTWDDTGITAGVLLLVCATLGALGPERPWLWALVVGMWIPVFGIATGQNYGSLMALAVAFVGAYGGMLVRRALVAT